jgi:peroxiredoxin
MLPNYRMEMRIVVKIAVLTALLTSTLVAGNRMAPLFELETLDGSEVSMEKLLEQGPVIIEFWATYCKTCDEELDLLNELMPEFEERNVSVLGISIDSPRNQSKIKPIVNSRKWTMPIPLDPESKVKSKYGVKTLPTLYIVSQEGEIVYSRIGYSPTMGEKILEIVRDLTPEPEEIPPMESSPCKEDSTGVEQNEGSGGTQNE